MDQRKNGNKSERMADLDFYFSHCNDIPSNASKDHYCWDPILKRPCCDSLEECRGKYNRAELNVFVKYGSPEVSIGKFTGISEAHGLTILGPSKKRVFPRAVQFRRDDEAFFLSQPNNASAAASDLQYRIEHAGRINTICATHDDPRTRFQIPVMKLTREQFYEIDRRFMGFRKDRLTMKDVLTAFRTRVTVTNGMRRWGGKGGFVRWPM